MSDEEDFKEQLRQEQLAKETEESNLDRTRVDPDGTVYEYDAVKKAWFPKIDADFIARYQMNYGTNVADTETTTPTTEAGTATSSSNTEPNSSTNCYNYYAKSGKADAATTDSSNYQDWYNYYYGNYTPESAEAKGESSDTTSETSIPPPPSDVNSQEYYDWYYMYYGAYNSNTNKDSAASGNQSKEQDASSQSESSKEKDNKQSSKQTKAEALTGKRREPEPPSWFEVSEDKNTNVYVSGLPLDMTDDEFKELMNKCGLIMFDPLTRKPKIKLYKDENGKNKGDGRCCYIKPESVELALQILDGSECKGHKIYVERARFELKGSFDPNKRRRKLTKQEKKKLKLKQEKLFDWRPDKPLGTRARWERIVILKNVFDPKVIEKDPVQINEIRKDMEEECGKYGDVRRVQVYDRNPEGVVAITFKEPEEADVCIQALNGRWFAGRQIMALTHDGKTKYHVDETEEEYLKRLKQWEDFLEKGGEEDKDGRPQNGMEQTGNVQSKDKQSKDKQSADKAVDEKQSEDEGSGISQSKEIVSENIQSSKEQSSDEQSMDVQSDVRDLTINKQEEDSSADMTVT